MADTDLLPAPSQTNSPGRSDKDAWFHRALGVNLDTSALPLHGEPADGRP